MDNNDEIVALRDKLEYLQIRLDELQNFYLGYERGIDVRLRRLKGLWELLRRELPDDELKRHMDREMDRARERPETLPDQKH